MLGQGRRRWASITPTLIQRVVFAGLSHPAQRWVNGLPMFVKVDGVLEHMQTRPTWLKGLIFNSITLIKWN